MNHGSVYQCIDSVRDHIAFLEKKALDHADKVRELEKQVIPKSASVHTTRLYWDCNCEKDYINHSYITRCEICGAHKADQPDSRLEELGMARLSGINELAERYARSNK